MSAFAGKNGKVNVTEKSLYGLWINTATMDSQKGFLFEAGNELTLFNINDQEPVKWECAGDKFSVWTKKAGQEVEVVYQLKSFNKFMMEVVKIEGKKKTKEKFMKAKALSSFQETRWILEKIGTAPAKGKSSSYDVYVEFKKDNSVKGYGSCNKFYAKYTSGENTLDVETINSSDYTCPLQENENKMIKSINDATHYRIVMHSLYLYKGKELLSVFKAKIQ